MKRAARPRKASASEQQRATATKPAWKVRMEAVRINNMADQLDGIPFMAREWIPPKDKPLREITDIDRKEIARYLRALASRLDILELMTAEPKKGRGKPADPETARRAYFVVLDYRITFSWYRRRKYSDELATTRKAMKEVCAAWGVSEGTIYAYREKWEKDRHWRWWASIQLCTFRHEHLAIKPARRLVEFCEKLREAQNARGYLSDNSTELTESGLMDNQRSG